MSHSIQAMIKHKNLVELLRWRAAGQPDQRAYPFLLDGETEAVHLAYVEK